jgi:hypothetical protein
MMRADDLSGRGPAVTGSVGREEGGIRRVLSDAVAVQPWRCIAEAGEVRAPRTDTAVHTRHFCRWDSLDRDEVESSNWLHPRAVGDKL